MKKGKGNISILLETQTRLNQNELHHHSYFHVAF